jgi:hypothetical protein
MIKLFNGKLDFFPGIWIVAMVIVLVGGRVFWVSANRPAHRVEIATAFGSIGLFYGPVQTDSAGTRITYIQQGEKGLAVFLCDTATGHRQDIYDEYDPLLENVRVWPWSPDDAYFSYSGTNNFAVCRADTGEMAVEFELDNEKVQDVAWLTDDEFVYFNDKNDLCSVQKQTDGRWQLKRKSELSAVGKISCLTAITTNSIAWLQNDVIWRMDLTEPTAITNVLASPSASIAQTAPPTGNLVLWLDASTLPSRADGAPVTNLLDQSRSRNNAVVNGTSPTSGPIYSEPGNPHALNGKSTIHFASALEFADTAGLKTSSALSITGAAPRSVFVVMRRDKDVNDIRGKYQQMVVNTGFPGTSGLGFGIYDKNYSASLPAGGGEAVNNNVHELAAGTWNLLEAAYDGTTEYGYANGILLGTKKCVLKTGSNAVQIGFQSPDFTHKFRGDKSNGDFAELLIYNTSLSADQRQQVQDYLAEKWFGGKLPVNLALNIPEVWFTPKLFNDMAAATNSTIDEFSYSKETGQLLISLVQNKGVSKGTSLWRFYPDENEPVQLLPAAKTYKQNPRWVGTGQYAFISNIKGNSTITVADVSVAKKTQTYLFETGNASRFTVTPDGKQFFVTGIASNEPADGIWQYEVDSALSHDVAPNADSPSPLIKRSDPVHGVATVNGRKLDYYLYRPADSSGHWKKHPLVIGNTVLVDAQYQQNPDGPLWAQALANCGAYVVIVDRRNWAGKEVGQWGENVMDIYDDFATNHTVNVDWNQVFLFASGSETPELNNLIVQRPELWKGAIFLNASGLPDFHKLPEHKPVPKILISVADLERWGGGRESYQEEVIKYGVIVNYIGDKGAPQLLQSKPDVLERTKAIIHFVFDD